MEIRVNASQWESLSDKEREKISNIISGYFKGAVIVPDVNKAEEEILANPFCRVACNTAEAAAVAACALIPGGPVAIAACIAAAKVAGDLCRDEC